MNKNPNISKSDLVMYDKVGWESVRIFDKAPIIRFNVVNQGYIVNSISLKFDNPEIKSLVDFLNLKLKKKPKKTKKK